MHKDTIALLPLGAGPWLFDNPGAITARGEVWLCLERIRRAVVDDEDVTIIERYCMDANECLIRAWGWYGRECDEGEGAWGRDLPCLVRHC